MSDSLIFIVGTSRLDGNTRRLVDLVNQNINAPVVNLSDCIILPYSYQKEERTDDFIKVASDLLKYKRIVFATPVYWYSMSSQMKVFFDRFSDLITERKDLGRALAGRKTYLISTGTDNELPPGFESPFELTSKYLDMEFQGSLYGCVKQDLIISQALAVRATIFADTLVN